MHVVCRVISFFIILLLTRRKVIFAQEINAGRRISLLLDSIFTVENDLFSILICSYLGGLL